MRQRGKTQRGKYNTVRETKDIMYTQRDRGKHETERKDRLHHVHPEKQREESTRQRGKTEYIMYTQRDRVRKA